MKEHGKNARVEGYSIGGKTGTSEDGVNTGKYVTSFIGVAPIENPQVAILITLYNPTGEGGHQGGGVAAPIASQIFSEVLPYLEIKNSIEQEEVIVENFVGKTVKESKEMLNGLTYEIISDSEYTNDSLIYKQIPEEGISINKTSKIILYCN